jgi:hypothetical protein
MRKNKLIEILSKIEGNPEITIWNGFVGDVMPIEGVTPIHLFKNSFEGMKRGCLYEKRRDNNDPNAELTEEDLIDIERCYKKYHHWETNQFVTKEDVKSGDWRQKTVYTIDAKLTGKKYFDRAGEVSY